ncbi:MAG: YihY family inner membrane protein [Candidatus Poribacteria bacterium]|nr:YihY family inner membrane protein [Candidatus Poribacteria bacterium]
MMNNPSEKHRNPLGNFGTLTVRLCANVWHQFREHNCLQQASALAFNTLVCLVPLSAVALFLLKTFGAVEDGNSPLIAALDNFLPRYGAEEIVSELSAFANRNLGGLGIGGFLLFLLVSTLLFMSVEQHLNDIWSARRRLPVMRAFQKYAVFYTLLTVGPLLIFLFFSGAQNWLFGPIFSWLLIYCLFFFMYIAMPNTTVKWRAALLGTFVAGTLFQIARIAFGRYFELVWKNYSNIYGALALLIILAIWTYAAWVIILLGAEASHVSQHLDPRGLARGKLRRSSNSYLNSAGVIALFLIVAERFVKGEGACTTEQVAMCAGVSEEVVHTSFEQFKAAGLIYEIQGDTDGYLPARGLSEITLDQLVAAVEGEMTAYFVEGLSSEAGARVLSVLTASQRECLADVTVASLL